MVEVRLKLTFLLAPLTGKQQKTSTLFSRFLLASTLMKAGYTNSIVPALNNINMAAWQEEEGRWKKGVGERKDDEA